MPINATAEYFKAEEKFLSAKTREEKIIALEEMIRECPKHKGTENVLAQLKSKLAKLKRTAAAQKKAGTSRHAVRKEGEAQVCLLGLANAGKSTLLKKLTGADVKVASYRYTTKQPAVGMMDYKGLKIQLVEIPATFNSQHMSIVRTADAIVFVVRQEQDAEKLRKICADKFINMRKANMRKVMVLKSNAPVKDTKKRIWDMLDLMMVYTRDPSTKKDEPMALPHRASVKDFAEHIHKDFIKNFHFARLWRKKGSKTIERQVGLNYLLEDGDIVEIHQKI